MTRRSRASREEALTASAGATVGGVALSGQGASREVALPTTVIFGGAILTIRRAKQLTLAFKATRMFQTWRRQLRKFDAGKAHGDRPLVTPDLDDPNHMATSS